MHESTGKIIEFGEKYIESLLPFLRTKEDILNFLSDLQKNKKKYKMIIKDGYKHKIHMFDIKHRNTIILLILLASFAFISGILSITFNQEIFNIVCYIFSSMCTVDVIADVIYVNFKSNNLATLKIEMITGVLKTQVEEDTSVNSIISKKDIEEISISSDLQNEIETAIYKVQCLKYPGYLEDLIRLHKMLRMILLNDEKLDFSTKIDLVNMLECINERINQALDSYIPNVDENIQEEVLNQNQDIKKYILEPIDK